MRRTFMAYSSLAADRDAHPAGGRETPDGAALPSGNPSYTEVLAAHARVVALTARVVGTGARDGVLGEYGLLIEERGRAEAAFRRLLRAAFP